MKLQLYSVAHCVVAFSFFAAAPKMAFTRFVDFADISRLSISRSLLVFCLQLKANCQEYCQYFFALRQKKKELEELYYLLAMLEKELN